MKELQSFCHVLFVGCLFVNWNEIVIKVNNNTKRNEVHNHIHQISYVDQVDYIG